MDADCSKLSYPSFMAVLADLLFHALEKRSKSPLSNVASF
jgi:hypothetical protein